MLSLPVMDKLKMAKATATMLLEIEAVHVNARDPFILTSGATSPVYIDCRKLISFVRIRSALMGFAASVLAEDAGFEAFDSVAGGETAGIPFAAFLAERLALPMQYIRKKPKGLAAMRKSRETCQRVLTYCWWRIWQQMAVASYCLPMLCVRRGRYVIMRL